MGTVSVCGIEIFLMVRTVVRTGPIRKGRENA
jgi:hypothetical protein